LSEPALKRRIGLWGAILLSFNGAVGAGIFALPGLLLTDFGSFAPWLFPLVALGSMLIVWPFARSVAAFPESGGPATYGRVFGRLPGFELGWVYYISRAAAFAANANVLAAYVARWWAGADEGLLRAALLTGVTALFAAANIAGVKRSLRLLGGLTILKALPLFLLALAAIALSFPPPAPGPLPPLSELEAGVLVVFYAFIGFENVTVPAGETRRPEVALPRAIFATMASMTLLYFLVQLAFVSALPGGGADEKAPLIDLGGWLAGAAGVTVITLTIIASLAGNLHSNLAATPRLTHAMGERGELPRWFGRVHPRFETPANSIAFMALLAGALALSGSFVFLAAVSVLSRLFVYAVTIAALPRAPARPRLTALHWIGSAIGIAVCAWAAAQADAQAWLTLGALAGAGLILYMLAAIPRRGAPR
jgi:basic amino acid/polyamine antiporter, APA family